MALQLVTGGSGFVGSYLVQEIARRGPRVRSMDLFDSEERPSEAEFFEGDVCDPGACRRAVRGAEVVYHCAALVPVTKAGKRFFTVNRDGTQNLLDAARAEGVRKFVFVSSSTVFGRPEKCPIDETTPFRPFEDYGRSKYAAELRVKAAGGEGLPYSIIRPRTILGGRRLGIFQVLFEWIREGRRIYIIGSGENLLQFVHIHDLVSAILLSAESAVSGEYNVGAETYSTLRNDLECLIRHAGTPSRVIGLPARAAQAALQLADWLRLSPLAPWHYMTYSEPFYFGLEKTVRELGWRARYGNIEMLCEAYDGYLEALRRPQSDPGKAFSAHRRPLRQKMIRFVKWFS